jgi:hypothetical protein
MICERCGNEIHAHEAHGLCPLCLITEAARPDGDGDAVRHALEARLRGDYRIIRLIGRGGMGAVYLARDLALDREVAIKVVKRAGSDRAMQARLRDEARTAARLSHPNIVPLHSFGEVDGLPYFVMGFVRGESLADRMRRDGQLPEEDARRILGDIADALDHAHRQGIVHLDIKPDNVLLDDETGRALLTDFGVARAIGSASGGIAGTPQYMSPEQAAGTPLDGRSDLYSLGILGYEMLAGDVPGEGAPPLRSLAPGVSEATAHVVERCIEKDAVARWQDARSFKLALGVVEEGHLPDSLRGVEGRGIPAVLITLAIMDYFLLAQRGWDWGLPFVETTLVVMFAIVYFWLIARLRREGFSRWEAQSAIWREPAWWLWWYPRALRRHGNVWDRMPRSLRSLRWSVFAFVVYCASIYFDIPLSRILTGRDDPFLAGRAGLTVLATIVVAWLVLTAITRRALGRIGLNEADAGRVMFTIPPSRVGYWRRPHIDAILAAAPPPELTERVSVVAADRESDTRSETMVRI